MIKKIQVDDFCFQLNYKCELQEAIISVGRNDALHLGKLLLL